MVTLIRRSPKKRHFFDECQRRTGDFDKNNGYLQLLLDCPTRWSSTTTSLIRIFRLQKSFDFFCQNWSTYVIDNGGKRTKDEILIERLGLTRMSWKVLGYMVDITKVIGFLTNQYGERSTEYISHVLAGMGYLINHFTRISRLLIRKWGLKHPAWLPPFMLAIAHALVKLDEYKNKIAKLGFVYLPATLLTPPSEAGERRFDHWAACIDKIPEEVLEEAKQELLKQYSKYRPFEIVATTSSFVTESTSSILVVERDILYSSPQKRSRGEPDRISEERRHREKVALELQQFYLERK